MKMSVADNAMSQSQNFWRRAYYFTFFFTFTRVAYLQEILQTGTCQLGTDELMHIFHCLDYQERPKHHH